MYCLLNVDSEMIATVSFFCCSLYFIVSFIFRDAYIYSIQHFDSILFLFTGQSSTKAAIRACRNAIEFNSIPSMNRLIPNGYDGLKLDVLLAVPPKYKDSLDLLQVQEVFPYGSIRFQVTDGGMIAPSGIAIEKLGDTNEDMVVVCVAVTVGY